LYFLVFAVLHQRLYNIKWIACSFFIYNVINRQVANNKPLSPSFSLPLR